MINLFSRQPYHDNKNTSVVVAGFILVGLLQILMGLYYVDKIWDFTSINPEVYNMVKVIMMSFVMVIGIYSLYRRAVLEGTVLVLIATTTLIFAMTSLLGAADGLLVMDILIGLCLLLMAVLFLIRRDWLLLIATAAMAAAAMMYPLFTGNVMLEWVGSGCLISGVLYLLYGMVVWMSTHENEVCGSSLDEDKGLYSVGYLILAILIVLVGMYYLNTVEDFVVMDFVPYNFAKIILSAIVILFGARYLLNGSTSPGMIFMLFGSSTLTFSASALMQGAGGLELADALFGIVMLFTALIAFLNDEKILSIVAFLLFISLTVYVFLSGDIIYYVVAIPTLIAGLIVGFIGTRDILRSYLRDNIGLSE